MKNALSRTLVDPRLADAEVIPTSTMQLPPQEPVVPTQDLVNEALSHRAELAEARINLKNEEISIQGGAQFLLPSLDLYAYYGGSGIGGGAEPISSVRHLRPCDKPLRLLDSEADSATPR